MDGFLDELYRCRRGWIADDAILAQSVLPTGSGIQGEAANEGFSRELRASARKACGQLRGFDSMAVTASARPPTRSTERRLKTYHKWGQHRRFLAAVEA